MPALNIQRPIGMNNVRAIHCNELDTTLLSASSGICLGYVCSASSTGAFTLTDDDGTLFDAAVSLAAGDNASLYGVPFRGSLTMGETGTSFSMTLFVQILNDGIT